MSCLLARPASTNRIDTEGSSIMTVAPPAASPVFGGADTHADTIHVAAIDGFGRELGDREFPTTPAGYSDSLAFLGSFGSVEILGIEGTSSYGAGLTVAARTAAIEVREVIRPEATVRRMQGKSDPIDAYQAARAALTGRAKTAPKDDDIEGLRALLNAHRSAGKARTAAMNQIHAQMITAPAEVREKYRQLSDKRLVDALATCRPRARSGVAANVLLALKMLAQRHRFLTQQAQLLKDQLRDLVAAVNLNLLSARGIGPVTAAQLLVTAGGNPQRLTSQASFAALCGTAPVPASSGKTTRYRLSRGGDRHANAALHTIATVRMSCDPRTRQFVAAQRAKQRSNPELLRILKRAIAREVFKLLQEPNALAGIDDLRRLRREKNLPLRKAVEALGTCQIHISRIERGITHDREFTERYRNWLKAA
ncbi:IS110 family transposase [Nocardioides ferulae]|uniref:IS110 family transposase n=1 Tax=Nocardioides ferulae TaxID=2340821 RepID=UPI001F0BBCB5|nr:IS110 family transposase [Nocardioides ferulae]